MIISKKSQLGLRFDESEVKSLLMGIEKDTLENKIKPIRDRIDYLEGKIKLASDGDLSDTESSDIYDLLDVQNTPIEELPDTINIRERVRGLIQKRWYEIKDEELTLNSDGRFYLITKGVVEPSKKINTGNFTGRALKDVMIGDHTYLIGKYKTIKFSCTIGAIKGYYFDVSERLIFEFGCDIESGKYYFPTSYADEFTYIMQLMTFIELGDVEIVMLETGRNNGKTKKSGDKVQNSSKYSVYVVDSSWNQMIVRTDGFGVMGHYRMQPCGSENRDRKLIWINAFQKNGYVRRPKAEILKQ